MKLRKYKYESEEEYIYRIWKMKDNKYLDMNSDEVAELLNAQLGYSYDESKYRKDYQTIARYEHVIVDEYSDIDAMTQELKAERNRLEVEKIKFRDERNAIKRDRRSNARFEEMIEEMHIVSDKISKSNPFILDDYLIKKDNGRNAVFLAGDWHIGAEFKNKFDEYNMDIAIDIINRMTDKVVTHCINNNVENLLVLNLNDLIEGDIGHLTARIESNADIIKQIMDASELLANMLYKISKHVNVKYASTNDNHSRSSENWNHVLQNENFYRLIDWHIENRFKNTKERIQIVNDTNFDDTIGYINFDDRDIFFLHGHLDSPKSVFKNIIGMTGIVPDNIYLGHYHSKFEIEEFGTKVLVNGSIKGVDSYVKNKRLGGANSKRKQVLHVLGEDDLIIDINF